jgi:N-methylhydantoinase A
MGSVTGIDIGGTFTDLAAYDPANGKLVFTKTSTTPAPDEGAVACLEKLRRAEFDVAGIDVLKHGTTVVINSILERNGAKTALITTEGFVDILEIGRGNRPESFNLFFRRLAPLVPRTLRFGIAERISASGEVLTPLDRARLPELARLINEAEVESIAICFLHAYRNPVHEREVADYMSIHTKCFVTPSHELSREFREYERTSTTVVNAFVGPRTSKYIERFEEGVARCGFDGSVLLMGSNGGVLTVDHAVRRPILLIESGPVGGAAGAAEVGRLIGKPNIIAFDMGGTTAKAVIQENGETAVTPVYYAAGYNRGYPVQAAVLDIIEVGTGGGSIAAVNELGALTVGPKSAGAVPGPVCYGKGGREPTVTDANLVLGRLNPDRFLDGEIKLDVAAAEKAIQDLAAQLGQPTYRVAEGIIRIATLAMASAVKMTTIERGHDPRDFTMVAYGGAGPLHASSVARELGVRTVVIPMYPGHFCAYGMLYADLRYDLVQTIAKPLSEIDLPAAEVEFSAMENRGKGALADVGIQVRDVKLTRYADMRYQGQEHTLKVKWPASMSNLGVDELRRLFEEGYRKRYGRTSGNMPVDVANFRVLVDGIADRPRVAMRETAGRSSPEPRTRNVSFDGKRFEACAVWERNQLPANYVVQGPAIVEEGASTTMLLQGDTAHIDQFGHIVIEIGAEK